MFKNATSGWAGEYGRSGSRSWKAAGRKAGERRGGSGKRDQIIMKLVFVRPDWICVRVVRFDRPWKGHQLLWVFDFLISLSNIWKEFKVVSRFIQKWIQPPACSDHGLYRILSSYRLAHFYLMKKSAKVLHYCGLDCGMLEFLQIFIAQAVIQRQLLTFPHFWRQIWWKRFRFVYIQPVSQIRRRNRGIFIWSGSELWSLFNYSKLKLNTKSGWCPFQGLSKDATLRMIQLAGQYL